MQITFDPLNPDERAEVARLLGTTAPAPSHPAAYTAEVVQHPAAYAAEQAAPTVAATGEEPTGPAEDPKSTDIHGMVWDESIHSNPPNKNADGSWRARRGKKDEYEAAIAAHKSASTASAGQTLASSAPAATAPADTAPAATAPADTAPAATSGMPTPAPAASMPAAAAPQTPPAAIEYGTMATRFVGKMQAQQLPVDYETVYADLEVGYADLETNQTSIARLWHYMDGLDQGLDHGGSVRHARGLV